MRVSAIPRIGLEEGTMNSPERHWLIPVRNGICALWLLVFVLFESYTAAGTALDHSQRFPAWESTLGWFLFLLPCELLVALAFLTRRKRASLGFLLVVANLIVYAIFMCFEALVVHESMDRTTLAVAGLWATFFALAIGAAQLLKDQASSP
jgi:hypothetical protein